MITLFSEVTALLLKSMSTIKSWAFFQYIRNYRLSLNLQRDVNEFDEVYSLLSALFVVHGIYFSWLSINRIGKGNSIYWNFLIKLVAKEKESFHGKIEKIYLGWSLCYSQLNVIIKNIRLSLCSLASLRWRCLWKSLTSITDVMTPHIQMLQKNPLIWIAYRFGLVNDENQELWERDWTVSILNWSSHLEVAIIKIWFGRVAAWFHAFLTCATARWNRFADAYVSRENFFKKKDNHIFTMKWIRWNPLEFLPPWMTHSFRARNPEMTFLWHGSKDMRKKKPPHKTWKIRLKWHLKNVWNPQK